MALEIFVERINQKKPKAHGGEKNQLHKNSVAHAAGYLCGGTVGAEDFKIIQARQPIEAGVPRMQRLSVTVTHLLVTHEKVIFTSSLVTMFPLGSLGEGGLIPKSDIFTVMLPFTVSLPPARDTLMGMLMG